MTPEFPPRPEAVIFDIGNVLIGWDPDGFYDRVIGADRRRALFAETDLLAVNQQIDLGADFRASVYAAADRHPDFADAIRMWHDRWIEMATPGIDGSARLLRALRAKGVPVFALSNFGVANLAIAQTKYTYLAEFDRSYISGDLGVIKPDPRIYEIVEKDCGIAPGALLFADDRPENIAVAEARGWQGHLFDGPDGWRDRLIAAGLLTQKDLA